MPTIQSELQRVGLVKHKFVRKLSKHAPPTYVPENESTEGVAPSILALYNHEGWTAVHNQATAEWVKMKLNVPEENDLFTFWRSYEEWYGLHFYEVLEREIPYALKK
jgi:hypothetical protein